MIIRLSIIAKRWPIGPENQSLKAVTKDFSGRRQWAAGCFNLETLSGFT